MASTRIQRRILQIGERQLHFRHAGEGAPVLLLHQSPRSSAELVPLLQFLAPHCLAIAPDAPGFGLSDPLRPSDSYPNIDEFCDALLAMIDALDLPQVAIFGGHTGAIIAVRFASRYPQRVSAVVANGILLTSAEERTDTLAHYLPRFVPAWDGSHLAWLWSRLRDQLVFYPWYRRDPVTRINWPQSLEDIEDGALDLLQAGDNYRGAYGAVLDYAIEQDLPQLRVPTLLLVARTDALSRFVELYPALPSNVEVSVVPDFPDIPAATLAFLKSHAGAPRALARPGGAAKIGVGGRFVELDDGSVHLRCRETNGKRTVLLLHDLGSSATALNAVLGAAYGEVRLLAPDLPGHGDSDSFGAITSAQHAAVLRRLLDALDVERFDIVAFGSSFAIAQALQKLVAVRVQRVLVVEPRLAPSAPDTASTPLLPDLRADIAGSQLLRAWYFLRDRQLFDPWYDRGASAQTPLQRPPRPQELQQSLIDLLKSRATLLPQLQATQAASTVAALAASGWPLLATRGCPARRHTDLAFVELPDEAFQWTAIVLRTLQH